MTYRFAMVQASECGNGWMSKTIIGAAVLAGLFIATTPLAIDLGTLEIRSANAFAMGNGNNDNNGGGNSGGGNSDSNGNGNPSAGANSGGPSNANAPLHRNNGADGNENDSGVAVNTLLGGGELPLNHGQRVRLFVALAKLGGFNASVGALQANFGTPEENELFTVTLKIDGLEDGLGEFILALDAAILARQPFLEAISDAQTNLDDAIAGRTATAGELGLLHDILIAAETALIPFQTAVEEKQVKVDEKQTEIDTAQATLDAEVSDVKPGEGPFPKSDGVIWELVNLDLNNDGFINEEDLNYVSLP